MISVASFEMFLSSSYLDGDPSYIPLFLYKFWDASILNISVKLINCVLQTFIFINPVKDRICGLLVRLPAYRFRSPGFASRHDQIFREVVGLERGPLSLVSVTEELLGRNNSGSDLESRECGHIDMLRWPCDTLYPQKLALSSLISGGCSSIYFARGLRSRSF
jgi:hypothetical protein